MHRLPEILAERRLGENAAAAVELELRVPADLEYFAGHFPGAPVLPGVVQLDWCMRLARERLALRGAFRALEKIRFLAPIGPDMKLTLRLELKGERLAFDYSGNEKKYSSGIFVFRE